jgi:hypothetical protein
MTSSRPWIVSRRQGSVRLEVEYKIDPAPELTEPAARPPCGVEIRARLAHLSRYDRAIPVFWAGWSLLTYGPFQIRLPAPLAYPPRPTRAAARLAAVSVSDGFMIVRHPELQATFRMADRVTRELRIFAG